MRKPSASINAFEKDTSTWRRKIRHAGFTSTVKGRQTTYISLFSRPSGPCLRSRTKSNEDGYRHRARGRCRPPHQESFPGRVRCDPHQDGGRITATESLDHL